MKHRDAAHPWLFIAILALAAGCSSGATTVSDGSTVDDTGVADTGNMDGAVEHDAGMDSGVPDTGKGIEQARRSADHLWSFGRGDSRGKEDSDTGPPPSIGPASAATWDGRAPVHRRMDFGNSG